MPKHKHKQTTHTSRIKKKNEIKNFVKYSSSARSFLYCSNRKFLWPENDFGDVDNFERIKFDSTGFDSVFRRKRIRCSSTRVFYACECSSKVLGTVSFRVFVVESRSGLAKKSHVTRWWSSVDIVRCLVSGTRLTCRMCGREHKCWLGRFFRVWRPTPTGCFE